MLVLVLVWSVFYRVGGCGCSGVGMFMLVAMVRIGCCHDVSMVCAGDAVMNRLFWRS